MFKTRFKYFLLVFGTLLEDFESIQLKDEDDRMVDYYKSTMITDKGEMISVVVDVKVKLPMILLTDHRISIRGSELKINQTNARFIANKHQIFFEGPNNKKGQAVKPVQEKTIIKTPPKLPPKPSKDDSSPQSSPVTQDEKESPNNIHISTERHPSQQKPLENQGSSSCCTLL